MDDNIDPAARRKLETAFRRLKPKHREIIILARVEGLTYQEMGVRLGLTMCQVERRMARAICELDKALDELERPWWRFW